MSKQRTMVTPTNVLPEKVVLTYTRRNRFWEKAKAFCDAQWLRSHGWIKVRDGWLLPHWHPKLVGRTRHRSRMVYFSTPGPGWDGLSTGAMKSGRMSSLLAEDHLSKTGAIKSVGEPYDLKHAVNSQYAHSERREVEAMLPRPEQDAPPFPSYVAWRPFQLILPSLGNLAGIISLALWPHWSGYALVALAVLLLAASCVVSLKIRKEWELDWAESQLRRAPPGTDRTTN